MKILAAKKQDQIWDWTLFFFILLYLILPAVYRSYSLFLIGNKLPTANGLAIISQWQFIQVFLEILQEAFVLPIFFFIGSKIKNSKNEIAQRIKTSFSILILIILPVVVIIYFNIGSFVQIIGTADAIKLSTESFLKIKIWSVLFNILCIGIIITVESLNKKRLLLSLTILKLLLSVAIDSLFYGGYSFSLAFGINGVAISNLIVDSCIFVVAFFSVLRAIEIDVRTFFKLPTFKDVKLFSIISFGSGVESLVKNVAYLFMIIKLLNLLGPQQIGGYYLTMHIFWSFALIPILALSETSKALIANYSSQKESIKRILKTAIFISLIVIAIWLVTTLFIGEVFSFFNNDSDILNFAQKSYLLLLPPYILLALNMIIDSLFYGVGKTKYMALQAIYTNGTVYLGAYILYVLKLWIPSFHSVMILFGIGIIVDSFFTVLYAKRVLKEIDIANTSHNSVFTASR